MGQSMDFDKELDLSIPDGADIEAIFVDVEVIPASASCLIYGMGSDGHTHKVTLQGGHSQVRLPFSHRKVYLKYQSNASEVRIGTIGHLDKFHGSVQNQSKL